MLKKLILACTALVATPALAQSFPKPPDVPAFTLVNMDLDTTNTPSANNTVVDSTVTPMPVGTGLTNIPIPSTTGRLQSNGPYDGTTTCGGSCTSGGTFVTTIPYGGNATENKFRTLVDFSHMLPDDPIRNYGQPGASHVHCFFGSGSTNAYSTYKSLRAHALESTAAGTDANGTGYWFPCIVVQNPYGDGKNYAIKANSVTVYYNENPATNGNGVNAKAFIPIGLRYVFGFDMDAGWNSTTHKPIEFQSLQNELATLNTANGGAPRYSLKPSGGDQYQIHFMYACTGATPGTVPYIVNPDGSDPFNGTCNGGQDFFATTSGPTCYDGTNLWAPGGYRHLVEVVYDRIGGYVCPRNYYKLPKLTIEIHWTQNGFADRSRWVLSSDLAFRAKYGLTAADVPAGMTFHTDWMDGWDDNIKRQWEINGLGVEHNTAHEMNSSQINNHQALTGGQGECGVANRCPQVDLTILPHVNQTDPGWMLIPPSWSGALSHEKMHQ